MRKTAVSSEPDMQALTKTAVVKSDEWVFDF